MVYLTRKAEFAASHYYHNPEFTPEENRRIFGKCNNPSGHGHRYVTETTIGGEYDKRTGLLFDFVTFKSAIEEALEHWQDRHLDLETEDFRENPSTGENIVRALWPKIDSGLKHRVARLRLWETANNRFTLRRT